MPDDLDIKKMCLGCMSMKENAMGACPNCGFDLKKYEHSPHQLKPDTILNGKYLVGRVLGEGGFGITYIGCDLNLDLKAAIKEFYPVGFAIRENTVGSTVTPLTGNKADFFREGIQKFVGEAKRLAKFYALPGIVSVKDYFLENGTAYIVMEYVEGITLKKHLEQRGGRLGSNEVFDLMRPVMDSLSKIHEAGIIHRDISPDNIMIGASGIKLIDFGAARGFGADTNKSLSVLLKPGYAPEEQYRTRGEQGPWTDVYALCATIYKCITGTTPPEALERIQEEVLMRPSQLGVQISPQREAALLKGMAIHRKDRFASIKELSEALISSLIQPDLGQTIALQGELLSANLTQGVPKFEEDSGRNSKAQSAVLKNWTSDQKRIAMIVCGIAVVLAVLFAVLKPSSNDRMAEANSQVSLSPSPVAATPAMVSERPQATPEATEVKTAEPVKYIPSREELARANRYTVACGNAHVLVQEEDGTILGLGNNAQNQCITKGWDDIIQMAGGFAHSIGLRQDGTVVATTLPSGDDNEYGQCNVQGWSDIVQIESGWVHSVGLKSDGSVVATGYNKYGQCDVSYWSNVIEVAAGGWNTAALMKDGHVSAIGDNQYGQLDTPWNNIRDIAVGRQFVVGLREDGTVVASGRNKEGQCNVSAWTDIVAIAVGDYHTVGLKADGTVVSTSLPSGNSNNYGQNNVSCFTDIVAVYAGARCTIGMNKDGYLVYSGIDANLYVPISIETGAHRTVVFSPLGDV